MHNPRERGEGDILSFSLVTPPTVWEPQNIFEKPLALFKIQRNATLEMQSMRIKFPACCQRNCRAAGRGEGGGEVGILGSSRVDRLAGDGVGPFTGQVAAAATEMLQQKTRRAI